jgi:hypothetical protein
MMCPRCKQTYVGLACEHCVERSSREDLLAQQRQFLPALFAGTSDFTLARPGRGKYHIVLIGDPDHAYCGQSIHNETRTRVAYSQMLPDTLCPACREQLAALRGVPVEAL